MQKDSRYAYLAAIALALNAAVFLFAAHQGRDFWWPYALLPVLMLLIGLAKRNAAFGVRNGWTRSSETVWRKTQLFSGGISAAVGIMLIPLCGFSSAPISAIGFAVGGFALIAVCSVLGSYCCFRRCGPAA
ncbi:MAG TPA: SdpI family protein [Firmicutes bacterium]|nr:SdpI family protein [Bacillota bacterium]